MSLGNLSIKVSADIGGFTSNMDAAAKIAQDRMGKSSGSVDDFRGSLLRASADLERAAKAMASNMDAANDAIIAGSEKSAEAVQSISASAEKADFKSLSEKIAYAVGTGVGTGIAVGQTAWDKFEEWTKAKSLVVGIAVGAIFAAVGLGAIYTAYKIISGSLGFLAGLLTGSSYKSENIDALIAANKQVEELRTSLHLTAQEASGLNAALETLGVSKADYKAVYEGTAAAIRKNAEELDRLGIKYKDQNGNFLESETIIRNVKDKLDEYTDGWDRNQAAAAIGIGTYAQVAAAAEVTKTKIAEARDRLNDYNLGIGSETQEAVKRYEDAMRGFNREADLTSQGFKRAIADNILPVLTDLAEFFKEGFPFAVNAFRYSMATITSLFYGLKTSIYMVAESIIGSIESIGLGLGALATAGMRVLKGDFSGAKDALVQGWTDAKNRLGQIGDNIVEQARHNAAAMRQAWALDDRNGPGIAQGKKKSWIAAPDDDEDGSGRKDPFKSAMDDLGRQQAGIDYVIANFDKFNGKVKESKAAMAEFDVTMGRFSDEQRRQEEFEPLTPAQKAAYIAKNKLIDDGLEKERQLAALRKFDKSADQFAFKEKQNLDNRKLDIEWMGKSQVELAKLTEARRIDGEVAAMIHAAELELAKEGLSITEQQRAAIYAKADAAKAAAQALIQKQDGKAKDPWFNAQESMRKYVENAENMGAQIGNSLTNAFKSAEDAMVSFVMTGKLSFKDLANSIIADLIRIQMRKMIAGLIGSIAGGGAGVVQSYDGYASGGGTTVLDGYANGGDPPINRPSIVGENGPEIFVPRAAGTVIPNSALQGGGGSNLNQTINIQIDGSTDMAKNQQMIRSAVQQGNAELVEKLQRAGRI
jgi:lambda family phage tail tape measure protein